jgi:type I restriction enzyme S subunit
MTTQLPQVRVAAKNLPPLPPNWEWGTVVDAAANEENAVVDGPFGSNLKLSDYIEPPGVPVLTTRNLRQGFGPATLRYISLKKSEELSRSLVRAGDVLMAKIGSCGVSCIYPDHMPPASIPANLLKVTVHPFLAPKYAHYYFSSTTFQGFLQEIITATAQPAFNVSKFRLLPFAFAPVLEQPRVVAEIEKQFTRLDAAVAALKRVQASLKRYRASVLKAACEGRLVPTEAELARAEGRDYEPADMLLARILKERRARWEADQLAKMHATANPPKDHKWKAKYKEPEAPNIASLPEQPEGWACATVEQVSWLVQYGSSAKTGEGNSGVPVLRMGNITADGGLDLNDLKYLPSDHSEFPELFLQVGDLLFNRTNSPELVGKSAVYHGAPLPCSFASYLIRVRTLDGCVPDYVAYSLNSTIADLD